MWTEERLNKMLTTPSEALSVELGRLEGDILVPVSYTHLDVYKRQMQEDSCWDKLPSI